MAHQSRQAPPPSDEATTFPIEMLEIATLRPHPRNDGQHPVEEIAHLRASIEAHGIYRNVVVATDGTILAGHGVVQAAQELGHTHIPGMRMPYGPDDARALQLLVGDNHIAGLRIQDDAVLMALLQEIAQDNPVALLGTGYDADGLQQLLEMGTTQNGTTAEASPPESFPTYDEDIPTEYCCPKCGYSWSGKPG